jgi:hypothetical protein
MLLNIALPPEYGSMIQYTATRKLHIPIASLSIVDNVGHILYYFFFLWFIDKLKGIPLWKMFIFSNIARVFTVLLASIYFDTPQWVQLASRFLYGLIGKLGWDLLSLPLIGRIGKFLPEGFESTILVIIISTSSMAGTLSGKLGSIQQKKYGIKNGYYERGMEVFQFNYLITTGLVIIAPIFLAWG